MTYPTSHGGVTHVCWFIKYKPKVFVYALIVTAGIPTLIYTLLALFTFAGSVGRFGCVNTWNCFDDQLIHYNYRYWNYRRYICNWSIHVCRRSHSRSLFRASGVKPYHVCLWLVIHMHQQLTGTRTTIVWPCSLLVQSRAVMLLQTQFIQSSLNLLGDLGESLARHSHAPNLVHRFRIRIVVQSLEDVLL